MASLNLAPQNAAPAAPLPSPSVDIETLAARLRSAVRGEVLADPLRRGIYATDASHYQITPRCVVLPRDEADAVAAIKVARELKVPITPRGGGTSLSGQTFGPGIVLDMSKHMDRVLEVDLEQRWARVQPGVVRDELNKHLQSLGPAPGGTTPLHFTPDPATGNRATIGGMVGNNTSGTKSVVYGKTIDNTLSCRVALADGTVCDFEPVDDEEWQRRAAGYRTGPDGSPEPIPPTEAEIYRNVKALILRYQDAIRERYPRVMRRVSGYNLDEFVDGAGYTGELKPDGRGGQRLHVIGPRADHYTGHRTWNLANLIIGSEGTLAVLLEARIRLVPLPDAAALCVVHFDEILESLRAVDPMLAFDPSTIELLDDVVMDEARINAATREKAWFIRPREDGSSPAAVQIVEFFGEAADRNGLGLSAADHAAGRARDFARAMQEAGIGYAHPVITDPAKQNDVWETRKLGLGLITNVKGPVKGRDFIEDACVPTAHLAEYVGKILGLAAEKGVTRISKYAHASVGVIHIAPALDLHREQDVATMHQIAERVFTWCMEYGGSWSGEHGDGQLRGQFLPRMFGEELYQAFRELKAIFDPDNLMNPGKVVDAPAMTENLRYQQPGYHRIAEVGATSVFKYRDQGGMQAAVEQCNGVGACRKLGSGTMCPSYMATRDEEHSTRGRANALRMVMSGQVQGEALGGDLLNDVLGLCLSCKACKTECPNAVDMSKMKADHLQQRYDRRGVTLAARLVGNLPLSAGLVSGPLAHLVNTVQKTAIFRHTLEALAGFDRRRALPDYSTTTFKRELRKRGMSTRGPVRTAPTGAAGNAGPTAASALGRVVLFNDTYINNFEPHVGISAIELLESCGYEVILANAGCCMRPALSKGLLRKARSAGGATIRKLDVYARQGLPIVCCEPSCAAAFTDDLVDLMDEGPMLEAAQRVRDHVFMVDAFLKRELDAGRLDVGFRYRRAAGPGVNASAGAAKAMIHGHCHQKALFGTAAMKAIYDRIPGLQYAEVDSGCCGMAGSFGYEHFDVSQRVYQDRLGPAVRQAIAAGDTDIVACGLSCRHQVHDFERGHTPRHWVETVRAVR